MTSHFVFTPISEPPFFQCEDLKITDKRTMSISDRQKTIIKIHRIYHQTYANRNVRVLDVSSNSFQTCGKDASADRLSAYVPELQREAAIENIYQASKCFEGKGPVRTLYYCTPARARQHAAELLTTPVISYEFSGKQFAANPYYLFYDWIYIQALMAADNAHVGNGLMEYQAFTDVNYDPSQEINCAAQAAAVYVSIRTSGQLCRVKRFDDFYRLMTGA